MRWGVAVFPGSCDDDDVVHCLRHVLGQDVRTLWHKDPFPGGCDGVVLPGGFSYGDYLRAGAMARFSPVMQGIVDFADGIGPAKTMIERQREIVAWAQEAGLLVHPYTFRADRTPSRYGSPVEEIPGHLFGFGVNGVFTDHPDVARGAIDWY